MAQALWSQPFTWRPQWSSRLPAGARTSPGCYRHLGSRPVNEGAHFPFSFGFLYVCVFKIYLKDTEIFHLMVHTQMIVMTGTGPGRSQQLPLGLPGISAEAGSEEEQPGFKLVTIWDANVAGSGFTYYATSWHLRLSSK